MKILVIGSGGREHALVWKIAQSPKVSEIFCAPGNAGTSQIAKNVDIAVEDIDSLLKFAKDKHIDLTVVGPEIPLVLGIVDIFKSNGLKIFGPTKAAAQIEGSKVFSKKLMEKYGIPTAKYRSFTEEKPAKQYLKEIGAPVVVKADGLAAGKGVIVCKTIEEAEKAIERILIDKEFKEAGLELIIEECLVGEEASILSFSYGKTIIPMSSAQDHKRINDNDEGPNTGGMGAYSPAPLVTKELLAQIDREALKPTILGMEKDGTPYSGILYVGVMVTKTGPKVLEYNARFGDPETQCILPRLKNDLVAIFEKIIEGRLIDVDLQWDPRPAVCVVMASGGYPGSYKKGIEITGLDVARELDDVIVFHAGTRLENGKQKADPGVVTAGGRVLNVVGLGIDIKSAIVQAYKAVSCIKFDGMHYRKDIGHRALNHAALEH